jgi:hypothetical protein
MKTFLVGFLLICLTAKYSQGAINCELKSGVSQAYNKVGEAALRGMKFHGGRTKNNMHLFQCTCGDDNVSSLIFLRCIFDVSEMYF